MLKRRLAAVLAALVIAIGAAVSPQVAGAEVQGSPPAIDCGRDCTWT